MKTTRIRVFRTGLPYVGGRSGRGAGNGIETATASVVVLDTDAGLSGCGEFTPCDENDRIAHSEGVPALARLVQGYAYAKAPFDTACWDLPDQACDQPVWMLPGGKLIDGAPLSRAVHRKPPVEAAVEMDGYRSDGYPHFQIEVGADWFTEIDRIRCDLARLAPGEKAMADANQGWRDLDEILEQPCAGYEACQQVRRVADHPMKLDECVTDPAMAQRIVADRDAEICCLKLSNLGGLSKARRVRDCLLDARIPVVAEDTWGGEITTVAVAHFAASTPSEFLQNTTDLMAYVTRSTGTGGATTRNGKLYAPDAPGLGVTPDFDSLGAPVYEVAA